MSIAEQKARSGARTLQHDLARKVGGQSPGKSQHFKLPRLDKLASIVRMFSRLSFKRVVLGGHIADKSRLSRYTFFLVAGLTSCWAPSLAYIKFSAPTYTSTFSMILPGAGASSSINLAEIGQASSAASPAYASSAVSPTVTYKNLIMSANVIEAAAESLGVPADTLSPPSVKLIDETSFILVEISGGSAAVARDRAVALQNAFLTELSTLRDDEIRHRESSTTQTVRDYESSVNRIRVEISALQIKSGLRSMDEYAARVVSTNSLAQQVVQTDAKLAMAKRQMESLTTTLQISVDAAAAVMKLQADPQFAALATAASMAQAALSEIEKVYGENHPNVVRASKVFSGAQHRMAKRATKVIGLTGRELDTLLTLTSAGESSPLISELIRANAELKGLEAQHKSELQSLDKLKAEVMSLVEPAAKLDSLSRDFKIAEAVFASALARINTSKTDIFASYPMVQTVEPPLKPLKPSSPNVKLAIGGSVAATLFLLVGFFLGWVRRSLIELVLSFRNRVP
jgi:uncharacterized protein involved in exopolysaccharide biosynthesis